MNAHTHTRIHTHTRARETAPIPAMETRYTCSVPNDDKSASQCAWCVCMCVCVCLRVCTGARLTLIISMRSLLAPQLPVQDQTRGRALMGVIITGAGTNCSCNTERRHNDIRSMCTHRGNKHLLRHCADLRSGGHTQTNSFCSVQTNSFCSVHCCRIHTGTLVQSSH